MTPEFTLDTVRTEKCGDFEIQIGNDFVVEKAYTRALEDFLSSDFRSAYRAEHPHGFYTSTGFPSPVVRVDCSSLWRPC